MIPVIAEHAAELEQVCRRYQVERLDLFGSVATGQFRPEHSDLDFVVTFRPLPAGASFDPFFGMREVLERLFGRSVDLVVGSAIKNPYFRRSVEATRTPLYEAGDQIEANLVRLSTGRL